jgi:hypothetical protein
MMTPSHCDKSPLKEIILRTEKVINCFKEEGMPISISIIACLECSIWVPQLVYFDKIHHVYRVLKKKIYIFIFFLLFPFSHFSQMRKATHFMVLGHISLHGVIF